MAEMKNAGVYCDIDYVVYETLDCGVISRTVKEKDDETLKTTAKRLEALVVESNRFIEEINDCLQHRQ